MTDNPFRYGLLSDFLWDDPTIPRRSGLLGDLPSGLGGLMTNPPPPSNALRDLPAMLAGLGAAGRVPAWNALTGTPYDPLDRYGALARALAGVPAPAPAVPMVNRFTTPAPLPAAPYVAPRRHAFFSFHYGEDINRVNVVRNSWRIRPEDGVPGFFDRSLWERTKRTDTGALKRMIRAGLKGTSVTCVLIGEHTWGRPWVRFEIAESVKQGNGLVAVDIDELYCIKAKTCGLQGRNPLDFMGVYRADDGRAYVCELWNGEWRQYPHLTEAVPWPAYLHDTGWWNKAHPLSGGTSRHSYKSEVGYRNLSRWIANAARAAKRR